MRFRQKPSHKREYVKCLVKTSDCGTVLMCQLSFRGAFNSCYVALSAPIRAVTKSRSVCYLADMKATVYASFSALCSGFDGEPLETVAKRKITVSSEIRETMP